MMGERGAGVEGSGWWESGELGLRGVDGGRAGSWG